MSTNEKAYIANNSIPFTFADLVPATSIVAVTNLLEMELDIHHPGLVKKLKDYYRNGETFPYAIFVTEGGIKNMAGFFYNRQISH